MFTTFATRCHPAPLPPRVGGYECVSLGGGLAARRQIEREEKALLSASFAINGIKTTHKKRTNNLLP